MGKVLKPSILVVEDEEAISTVIKYNLQKNDFVVEVVADGLEALEHAKKTTPDIILLDWMLPSMSGIEVCKELRADSKTANTPIIMISAKGEEYDRISGLDTGADDYIVKPFSPAELVSRINAILRRLRPAFAEKTLSFEDIVMDLGSHEVIRNGKEVKLAPIEFQILQILMEHPNRVMSRDALIDKIWGSNVYVGARTVDVHITRLRKALMKAGKDGDDVIKTIRLAGYTLRNSSDNTD